MTVRAEALETLGSCANQLWLGNSPNGGEKDQGVLTQNPLKNSGLGIIETLEVDFDYLLNGLDPENLLF